MEETHASLCEGSGEVVRRAGEGAGMITDTAAVSFQELRMREIRDLCPKKEILRMIHNRRRDRKLMRRYALAWRHSCCFFFICPFHMHLLSSLDPTFRP